YLFTIASCSPLSVWNLSWKERWCNRLLGKRFLPWLLCVLFSYLVYLYLFRGARSN
ncbi:hypothetical protein Bpfe_021474, partial [Biomphalaria pfeifferi]